MTDNELKLLLWIANQFPHLRALAALVAKEAAEEVDRADELGALAAECRNPNA